MNLVMLLAVVGLGCGLLALAFAGRLSADRDGQRLVFALAGTGMAYSMALIAGQLIPHGAVGMATQAMFLCLAAVSTAFILRALVVSWRARQR